MFQAAFAAVKRVVSGQRPAVSAPQEPRPIHPAPQGPVREVISLSQGDTASRMILEPGFMVVAGGSTFLVDITIQGQVLVRNAFALSHDPGVEVQKVEGSRVVIGNSLEVSRAGGQLMFRCLPKENVVALTAQQAQLVRSVPTVKRVPLGATSIDLRTHDSEALITITRGQSLDICQHGSAFARVGRDREGQAYVVSLVVGRETGGRSYFSERGSISIGVGVEVKSIGGTEFTVGQVDTLAPRYARAS